MLPGHSIRLKILRWETREATFFSQLPIAIAIPEKLAKQGNRLKLGAIEWLGMTNTNQFQKKGLEIVLLRHRQSSDGRMPIRVVLIVQTTLRPPHRQKL